KSVYSSTVLVPKTKFPVKIGNKTSEHEIEIQSVNLYNWQLKNGASDKVFTLHDGPPYANGDVHVGHALNKILKDITNRYKLLRGFKIHYKPGWDCHGLPIEIKAIKTNEFNTLTPPEIRKKSKLFAEETIKVQKKAFERWGIMADWENGCYYTFDKSYQAKELTSFYNLYKEGLIYRDLKPVFWSPSSGTALAESELEYNADHVSRESKEIFFWVITQANKFSILLGISRIDDVINVLVWTTQPWTFPANQALCYSANIKYCLARPSNGGCIYLMALDCVNGVSRRTGFQFQVFQTFDAKYLEGLVCGHPMYFERTVGMISSDHTNTSKGTGIVHIAPAHGVEDFGIGQKHNFNTVRLWESQVDSGGHFNSKSDENLRGKFIFTKGNEAVIDILEHNKTLVHQHDYKHNYPCDWRTKQPIFVQTSRQWFVDTESLRSKAEAAIQDIKTYPDSGKLALLNRLHLRTYWCISRQRTWGVPIPVCYHKETGEVLMNQSTIDHVVGLVSNHGSDIWWEWPLNDLLPADIDADMYERGTDIFDIWFDSGVNLHIMKSIHSGGSNASTQADFYIEGKDQLGGWFQSSLLTSVGLQGNSPYRNLMIHGFTLAADGQKMSKSLGNVVDPMVITDGGKHPVLGADALRWWVAESNIHQDIHISDAIMRSAAESVQKVRNSLRFMMSNLNEFNDSMLVPMDSMLHIDRYFMGEINNFKEQVTDAYEGYEYSRATRLCLKLIKKLSNVYFSIIKDRLYCDEKNGIRRASCQSVLYYAMDAVVKSVAPVLPHLVEETSLYNP
uniref:isoleucine--tRNA ligase n=1 Tax=Ciona savignyi TaxID=51511 RepID=H2YST3_CIOSA